MAFEVKRVEYYSTTVESEGGDASRLLHAVAGAGISLLAFKAVAAEPGRTRFTLFSGDGPRMAKGARQAGLAMEGPRHGLLIQGDDVAGALADIYERLSKAGVRVDESSGIADIRGAYGVVLYLGGDGCDRAMAALSS